MFIDFHAHFLHGIDDGATDVSTGVAMLSESWNQGTKYILATPHFHYGDADINEEISKRDTALAEIKEYAEANSIKIPHIISGFEVDFKYSLKNDPQIDKLCIEGTNHLLVEMPYNNWKQNDIEALYELTLMGIKPVIAHVDRYYRCFGDEIFDVFDLDAVFQMNCKVMETIAGRNFVKKIMKAGKVCVMGTDMHNLTTRTCNIQKAHEIAHKKLFEYSKKLFYVNAAKILLFN